MPSDRERNNDRWEARGDRVYSAFTEHPVRTILFWFAALCLLVLVLGLIGSAFGWVGSWGGEARRVTGPANSQEQTTAVLREENAMIAAAQNVCDVESAGSKNDKSDPTLIEDPALAYRATYRNAKAEYDRRMSNVFEARLVPVGLRGLPRHAPSLRERMRDVC